MKRLIPVILALMAFCACQEEQINEGDDMSSSDLKTIKYLNDKAWDLSNENPNEAIELATQALVLSSAEFYLPGEKDSHNILYYIYLNELNDIDKAAYHQNAFEKLSEELKESKDLALLNYKKGYTLYKEEKLSESVSYLFEARDLYYSQGDFEKEAYSLYALSLIFEKVKQYEKGIEYLKKVNFEALDKSFSWSVYFQRGKLNLELKNYAEAHQDFKNAYRIVAGLSKTDKEVKLLNGLALVSIELAELEQADHYISEGLRLAKATENHEWEAMLFLKQGYRHEKASDYREATSWYKKAYDLALKHKFTNILLDAALDLSNSHNHLGDFKQSIYYAKVGIDNASDNDAIVVLDLYRNLSTVSQAIGDSLTFYKYQSKAEKITVNQLKNSEFSSVHKEELAYKDKIDERRHRAYIDEIHAEIAEHNRYKNYYLMIALLAAFGIVFILCMRLPIRFVMKRLERFTYLTEELQAAFKKRLNAKGPIFPYPAPILPPELPDERDLHNLWRKDKHGRKGDKDKNGDDPAPGLDD